ncbi:Ankyrin repeat and FYVE domain-containing protein 1 [Myotis davidii]|uniref:Ankyrin repeat and FYVE domain-containing protein 1 n=1 Tax=Myotis davidii TaxID=225400 RepID=L5LMC7_MYODS|nr:Ankyrin repeat and FYVE domain-containing protein 1 [Myotis davidii]
MISEKPGSPMLDEVYITFPQPKLRMGKGVSLELELRWRHLAQGRVLVLLLAYMKGNANLCRAIVRSGARLGVNNNQGVNIFNYQVATKQLLFRLLERKEEGERDRNINDERESLIGCLLHTPHWGLSPQPRHVPLARIEPGTLQSAG